MVLMVVPVALREGGEDPSGEGKFEAAVAAGGIRVFFGGSGSGEANVSSRMRKRLTARRDDWDIRVWSSLTAYSSPTVTVVTVVDSRRETREKPSTGQLVITCEITKVT